MWCVCTTFILQMDLVAGDGVETLSYKNALHWMRFLAERRPVAAMTAGETCAWKEASSNSCIQPVGTDRRCVAKTDSKLSARRENICFFVNVLGISIIFEHQGIVG